MKIEGIDHIVLTVSNIEATLDFYSNILGMEIIEFGENRKALKFGNQKINLHRQHNIIKPRANNPMAGSADICLITKTSIEEVVSHLNKHNVKIELGPIDKVGALGDINSIYIRDPDNNLIEISNYKN
ncbi:MULTISPECIES: VOC family protein [Mammaliicoccus]|uniref:VOC family protein n=1 Tax=Mammaliicoccus TaxID=2803850 RepID=UPI000D1D5AEE|nr:MULTISPECIES: VOC family protein [Mammaliicoccus]PTJ75072.1 VOC family virulence protein [Mammaliicoccus sciuri]PTK02771.1 VOC family virulence protein [Mammaliicoccus sciuri]PTK15969.1 VOC family virulence protein [Mammaliicoccus sciuri]